MKNFFQRESSSFILQMNKTFLYALLGTGLRVIPVGQEQPSGAHHPAAWSDRGLLLACLPAMPAN